MFVTDKFKEQLSQQEFNQKDAHDTILQDLASIQDNAMKIWEKLGEAVFF